MGEQAGWDKYTLIKPLGRGGEGNVYLARDEHLRRYVAVKHVRKPGTERTEADRENEDTMGYDTEPENNGSTEEKEEWDKEDQDKNGRNQRCHEDEGEKIMREAGYLQQLRHPMLPAVYDLCGDGHGGWYLVMEYIQGWTLRAYIEKNGYVQEKQARVWGGQLADVLEHLHTRKPPVIYSDLKPDNIMVCPDGELRLIDFGAAVIRSFGTDRNWSMAVTPGYGAPEQTGVLQRQQTGQGRTDVRLYADERSDIYALGMILYYMVTGADPASPPYTALPVYEYQPLLGDSMEAIIRKCIRQEPEARYQTAGEVQKDLGRYAGTVCHMRRKSFIRAVEKRIWLTEGAGIHSRNAQMPLQ